MQCFQEIIQHSHPLPFTMQVQHLRASFISRSLHLLGLLCSLLHHGSRDKELISPHSTTVSGPHHQSFTLHDCQWPHPPHSPPFLLLVSASRSAPSSWHSLSLLSVKPPHHARPLKAASPTRQSPHLKVFRELSDVTKEFLH